jgi:hypothetical protein
MTILSLDVAGRTGWARLTESGRPVIGHWDFTERRMPFADFRKWLVGMVQAHRITTIAVEDIYYGKNPKMTADLARKHGIVEEVVQTFNLRFIRMTADEWRRPFIGCCKAPKSVKGDAKRRAWLKKAARAECERRGWPVANDDQADAAGVLDFARCLLDKRYGAESTPLFEAVL